MKRFVENNTGMDKELPIDVIELSGHKYLLHAARLEILARGGDVYPVTVELDMVDYCNHNCRWCVDPYHGQTAIDLALACRLLDELSLLGVKGIVFKGGGEPTLHPNFSRLLQKARENGFETGLITNGSILKKHAEQIALHASYVRISLDGPTSQTHHSIHRVKDFSDILSGVRQLVSKRKEQRHPVIGLSFAMDISIIDSIPEAVRLGDSLGVDYILFRTPFYEEVGRNPTMNHEETRIVRTAFRNAQQSYEGKMKIFVDHWISDTEAAETSAIGNVSPRRGSYLGKKNNGIEHTTGTCLATPLLAVVTADGTVYPCCNLRGLKQWGLGQLNYPEVTFEAIWQGQQRKSLLDQIHSVRCIRHCTHPLSKYNEAIQYLQGPRHHGSFI